MGINTPSDMAASIQIGPTDQGMVRIYVEGEDLQIPMDFEPDEAAEIAEELLAAVEAARGSAAPENRPARKRRRQRKRSEP